VNVKKTTTKRRRTQTAEKAKSQGKQGWTWKLRRGTVGKSAKVEAEDEGGADAGTGAEAEAATEAEAEVAAEKGGKILPEWKTRAEEGSGKLKCKRSWAG
jgi:hypothetical protein